jgi:nucleoside-diphosphate-sugar epimerase
MSDAAAGRKPVLVTGATGYVAGPLVRELLERGYTVHAALRDAHRQSKREHLDAAAAGLPGQLRYFESDLLKPGSYAEAMRGCSHVFHTASPFVLGVEDPQRDLVDPAVLGTRNVLETANQTGSVVRVIVTSSVAAIYGDNADLKRAQGGVFSEDDWNTSSSLGHQPYSYSKVMAEREAWKIAEAQSRWRLVTVNPSLVLGPGLKAHGGAQSYQIVQQMCDGTMKAGVPDFRIGLVDVRDVALCHVKAAFEPEAQGRYLCSGWDSGFVEMARILRESFGDEMPIPKRKLPKFMVWLFGPMLDKAFTRRVIARNIGRPFRADHGKSVRELGMSYRRLEETLAPMVEQMRGAGLLGGGSL